MDAFDEALTNFDIDAAIANATRGSLPSASPSAPSPLDGGRREARSHIGLEEAD